MNGTSISGGKFLNKQEALNYGKILMALPAPKTSISNTNTIYTYYVVKDCGATQ